MYSSFSFNLEPRRILFLDIDGVVNTIMIYSEPIKGRNLREKDGFYIDLCHPDDKRVSNEFACRWLSKLCLEYNLDIVISSSWAIGNKLNKLKKALYNSGLDSRINIIDKTSKNFGHPRGAQIEAWLIDNDINLDRDIIIILDDDSDMLSFKRDYTPYLIKCNTYTGFGLTEYSHACEFLDKQIETKSLVETKSLDSYINEYKEIL